MNRTNQIRCKLLVSPEHRVYLGINNQINPLRNNLTKSDVVNTLTSDCCLRCGSLDQIAALMDKAAARYGASSGSDKTSLALLRNALYSESSINSISDLTSFCLISNSCSESLDLNKHSSLCSSNSDLIKSGAENAALIEKNKYELTECGFISEKNTLLSGINIILIYSPNLFLSSGESCESNFLNLPFLAFLPNSTDHLINSCSSLECSFFNNSLAFLSRSINLSLTSSDQFTQRNLDILDLSSGSAANVMDAIKNHLHDFWGSKNLRFPKKLLCNFLGTKNLLEIFSCFRTIYITPLAFNSSSFSNSSIFSATTPLAIAATFIAGNSFLNLFNSSSGTETVTFGILSTSEFTRRPENLEQILAASNNYFNTSNYVDIYKSFGFNENERSKFDEIIGNNLVAFFDNQGNLKLKGSLNENYTDP